MAVHGLAKDDPDSAWDFCPNKAASYLYAVLFSLTLIAHIAQAIIYRKGYSWVISMGALWEAACYGFRTQSIYEPTEESWYTIWFVLILLAPLWINAYVYMAMGRMVYNFTTSASILGIKAWRTGLYFVILDIFAFLVQATGAAFATGDDLTDSQILRGLHIYMGGVGLQQIFVFCFFYLAIRFKKQVIRDMPTAEHRRVLALLYVIYAVLILITVRIIFRLIEYSQGLDSTIPLHEAYQYVFDSTTMLFALVLLNIVHPGRIMPGKESDFPSRKERKAAGKNIQGRAKRFGVEIPLYETEPSEGPSEQASMKPTSPEH